MIRIRRKPKLRGIQRGPQREFPKHRKWVRGHACIVPDCPARYIECAHVRTGTDGGTGQKPSDFWTVPLCGTVFGAGVAEGHHAEQHRIGEPAFEKKYGLNLKATAMKLANDSPDLAMREVMRDGR